MKGWINNCGYPCVKLRRNKIRKSYLVHRLVLLTFRGPCPDGMEGRHLDGDPKNCHLSNLKWDTPKENAADKIQHGTHLHGSKSPGWKGQITEEVVFAIRNRVIAGESTENLAKEFSLSVPVMRDLINGRRWKHVPKAVHRARKSGRILYIDP